MTDKQIKALNETFFSQVEKVFEEAKTIRASRMDYNTARPVTDYLLHGPEDFIYEIYKKALRADSLIKAGAPVSKVNDSMLDIINYAAYIMVAMHLEADQAVPLNKV